MNQPSSKLLIFLVSLAVAIGLGTWAFIATQPDKSTATEPQPAIAESPAEKAGRTEIVYLARPGITSLEQLQEEARDVAVEESEYGKLVTAIEGHVGGSEGKYWSFYVNGEMASVGADSYVQKEGDWIEWKFQKL